MYPKFDYECDFGLWVTPYIGIESNDRSVFIGIGPCIFVLSFRRPRPWGTSF